MQILFWIFYNLIKNFLLDHPPNQNPGWATVGPPQNFTHATPMIVPVYAGAHKAILWLNHKTTAYRRGITQKIIIKFYRIITHGPSYCRAGWAQAPANFIDYCRTFRFALSKVSNLNRNCLPFDGNNTSVNAYEYILSVFIRHYCVEYGCIVPVK